MTLPLRTKGEVTSPPFDICTVPALTGPFVALMGCYALFVGAIAWDVALPRALASLASIINLEPSFEARPRGRDFLKIVGPLNGTIFLIVGTLMTWGTLHCAHIDLGIPDMRAPLPFVWWNGLYPAIAISLAAVIYNARRYKHPLARVLLIIGGLVFGLGGGEAAGFHIGPHATQWFVVAIIGWLIAGISYWINRTAEMSAEKCAP